MTAAQAEEEFVRNAKADRKGRLFLAAALLFVLAVFSVLFIRLFMARISAEPESLPEIGFNDDHASDIWFLNAGAGDSTLLRTPGGKWILIDCGQDQDSETLCGILEEKGVRTISWLILTYDHPSRTGGLRSVLDRFDVRAVCFAAPPGKDTEELLKNQSESSATAIMKLNASIEPAIAPESDLSIFVLSPLDAAYPAPGEDSAVLKITQRNTSVLLNSEADSLSERLIIKAFPNRLLHSDIVRLGSRSGDGQIGKKYLKAIKPSLVILSRDSDDPALEYLRKKATEIRTLEEDGTIHVRLDGNSFRVVEY